MLDPQSFFDLADFRYKELFADLEYVWEVLNRRDEFIKERVVSALKGKIMPQAIIEGEVYLGEGSIVEPGAYIKGPTIIGENTLIRHGAYIRGNVLIGDNCIIGHSTEVKGSIMLNHSRAPHFAYVGDSVLGNEVNLGAGTRLSNVKVTKRNIKLFINGREYDTRLTKFGAIIGDRVQTGCNTVTNPGTLIGRETIVYANISLRGYYPPHRIVKLKQDHQIVDIIPNRR